MRWLMARRVIAVIVAAACVGVTLWLHTYRPYAFSTAKDVVTSNTAGGRFVTLRESVSEYRRKAWELPAEGVIVVLGVGLVSLLAFDYRPRVQPQND